MDQNMRLSFRKGDWAAIFLVVLLIAATALAFFPRQTSSENAVVQIYQDGTLLGSYPLKQDTVIPVTGAYENTVTIHGGKAAITASSCPGEDCIHSGWISSPGKSIVCLPNRVEIRIVGASDVDFIVG